MRTLEQVDTRGFLGCSNSGVFTYSPSAIHSISSTCPLRTVLELEGPDGMRKFGFLSSAGSSMVARTDSQREPLVSDPGLRRTLHNHNPFLLFGIM